jgi:monofunctional biosynthetic peptidoglycan transglycosylase
MARLRNFMRNRWLKRFLVLMAGVLALPYLLTLVYAVVPPPVSATMLWKKLEGQQIDYRWRPLSDTSQNLVRSVVTAEDAGICRHNGVEWAVLGEVITEAMEREGGPTRGGSTITQQVAKNLFLWPSRSYVRKGLEIRLPCGLTLSGQNGALSRCT